MTVRGVEVGLAEGFRVGGECRPEARPDRADRAFHLGYLRDITFVDHLRDRP